MIDRAVRVVAGVALAGTGLVFARGVLMAFAIAGGALLVLSGTVGFCHVYKVLGLDSLKRR